MNKLTSIIGRSLGGIVIPLILLVSCASLQRYLPAIQEATRIGAQEALRDHPEWKPAFSDASVQLRALAQNTNATVLQLLAVIQSLPVSELSSDQARWSFDGVRLLVVIASVNIDITKPGQVAEFATAVANGIDQAISHPSLVRPRVGPAPPPKHYKIKVSK